MRQPLIIYYCKEHQLVTVGYKQCTCQQETGFVETPKEYKDA